MEKRYYLDTSIWLDFFETRDEPHMPKGLWAHELLKCIIQNDSRIIYSDIILLELNSAGYPLEEIEQRLQHLRPVLIFVEATSKQIGKAIDLSQKREIPKGDALHALIARDNKAIMVTLDRHFQKLLDITKLKGPRDIT